MDGEELEHTEYGNMPEWAEDAPRSYWQAADDHERTNGRLYREIQFALPKELSENERWEVASGFACWLSGGERLPYTLTVHRDVLVKEHGLSDRQAHAIGHILENGSLTIQDFERLCPETNRRSLQRDLKAIIQKGIVFEKATSPTGPTKRYVRGLGRPG